MSKIRNISARLNAVKTEIALAEQAAITLLVAFDVWNPSQEQLVALGGFQTAVLALLVGWYRKP